MSAISVIWIGVILSKQKNKLIFYIYLYLHCVKNKNKLIPCICLYSQRVSRSRIFFKASIHTRLFGVGDLCFGYSFGLTRLFSLYLLYLLSLRCSLKSFSSLSSYAVVKGELHKSSHLLCTIWCFEIVFLFTCALLSIVPHNISRSVFTGSEKSLKAY